MPKDFRGKEYNVGDIILYPRMYAKSVLMQEATVLEIKEFEDSRWVRNPYFDESLPVDIRDNPRQIREKFIDFKVKVQPTRSSRYSSVEKPVWITMKQNIVKA